MRVIFSLQILEELGSSWEDIFAWTRHAVPFIGALPDPQTLQSSSLGTIAFRAHSRALRLNPQEPLAWTLQPFVFEVECLTQYSYTSHGAKVVQTL